MLEELGGVGRRRAHLFSPLFAYFLFYYKNIYARFLIRREAFPMNDSILGMQGVAALPPITMCALFLSVRHGLGLEKRDASFLANFGKGSATAKL